MSRLAYIQAASHSGSTLLAMLLGTHPELCTVGELKLDAIGDVDRYRCSCGEPLLDCPFWQQVRHRMNEKGLPLDFRQPGTSIHQAPSPWVRRLLEPLHRGPFLERVRDTGLRLSPSWSSHLDQIQRRNAALVASVLELSETSAVVDSSKIGTRLKYLLRNPELDVTVVRLIRDGRAVALTYMDPLHFADADDPTRRAGGFGGTRPGLSMDDAAREWRRSNEEADHMAALLPPDRMIRLRYEDLCRDPAQVLGRVFAFLGVKDVDVRGSFRAQPQHVVGNGMRLDSRTEIQLDERWRETLGPEDLARFESVAGSLNRDYGYA